MNKDYVTSEEISSAKQMDLLTYLRTHEPYELVKLGGGVYSTKTYDSLKISNGKWFRWSRGVGGRSALDYLVKVRDMGFVEAVRHMNDIGGYVPQPEAAPAKVQLPRELKLPPRNGNHDRVIRYLAARGIDGEVIDYCIQNKLLYEDAAYHNCVFVGFDGEGIPKYAALRSSNPESTFLREADGSDKRYSFRLGENMDADTVHLFECAIDVLSYATLEKLAGRNWRAINYLSLAGVYQPKADLAESEIPIALGQYLKECPHTTHISLCLDNDRAGRLAAYTITALLDGRCTTDLCLPERGKDYNAELMLRKGIQTKVKTRGDAR